MNQYIEDQLEAVRSVSSLNVQYRNGQIEVTFDLPTGPTAAADAAVLAVEAASALEMMYNPDGEVSIRFSRGQAIVGRLVD